MIRIDILTTATLGRVGRQGEVPCQRPPWEVLGDRERERERRARRREGREPAPAQCQPNVSREEGLPVGVRW